MEDVLGMVDKLISSIDFYVLDMDHDKNSTLILLGRLFMKTTNTKIDLSEGSVSMELDGEVISYNIYDDVECPSKDNYICVLNVTTPKAKDVDIDPSTSDIKIGPTMENLMHVITKVLNYETDI